MAGQLPRSKSWSPGECKFPVLARHGAWACAPHLISRYRGSLAASLTASFFRQDILTCACDGCCWHGGAIHGGGARGCALQEPAVQHLRKRRRLCWVLLARQRWSVPSPLLAGYALVNACRGPRRVQAADLCLDLARRQVGSTAGHQPTAAGAVDLLGCLPPVQLSIQSPLLSSEA